MHATTADISINQLGEFQIRIWWSEWTGAPAQLRYSTIIRESPKTYRVYGRCGFGESILLVFDGDELEPFWLGRHQFMSWQPDNDELEYLETYARIIEQSWAAAMLDINVDDHRPDAVGDWDGKEWQRRINEVIFDAVKHSCEAALAEIIKRRART